MKTNTNRWLEAIDDSTKLFQLNIPGTHDSVTQRVQFSHVTKCQDLTIFDQLDIGVRCLDLRVKSKDNALIMVHSIATAKNPQGYFRKQMDMADVLDQCYQFLDKNPSESIIIQFKNDNNKEMERCFDLLFHNYIGKNKARWYVENRIPTLGETRGKLVLVRRCAIDSSNQEYNQQNVGIDFSSWVEQDKLVPEPLLLDTNSVDGAKFLIQDRFKYNPEQKWETCVKPFFDSCEEFSGEYKISYLSTAGGIRNPEYNAKYINANFLDYSLNSNNYYGIIYIDFPTEEITQKIIDTNL